VPIYISPPTRRPTPYRGANLHLNPTTNTFHPSQQKFNDEAGGFVYQHPKFPTNNVFQPDPSIIPPVRATSSKGVTEYGGGVSGPEIHDGGLYPPVETSYELPAEEGGTDEDLFNKINQMSHQIPSGRPTSYGQQNNYRPPLGAVPTPQSYPQAETHLEPPGDYAYTAQRPKPVSNDYSSIQRPSFNVPREPYKPNEPKGPFKASDFESHNHQYNTHRYYYYFTLHIKFVSFHLRGNSYASKSNHLYLLLSQRI
jgi:hypothetical protein